jgi:hypothetical protein
MSLFVHMCSGATLDDSLGNTQAERVVTLRLRVVMTLLGGVMVRCCVKCLCLCLNLLSLPLSLSLSFTRSSVLKFRARDQASPVVESVRE